MKMGMKSPAFYLDLVKSRRNLSFKSIPHCCKALGFNKEESEYFENLVLFNQAKTIEEKNRFYQKMLNNKKVNMNLISKEMYEFYSKWHHTAIREMLFYYPFKNNYRDLAKQLYPSITEDEAKKSIELQERLGFIEKSDFGYKQKTPTITTGDEITQAFEVANFQLNTMDLAKHALDNFSAKTRDISTLTLSLSEKGFKNIKSIIQNTRKDILKEAQLDENESKVYQINLQLFPLTKEFTSQNKG